MLVGGPPCQAFARVDRSQLREIDAHPQAFKPDPRARLYLDDLRYVEAFQPLTILMENVPDVLNHGGHNIADEICDVLEEKGYATRYTLLNAFYCGVPQMRERMFLIGHRRELDLDVTFPEPTHWVDLPPGYEGSRQVGLPARNFAQASCGAGQGGSIYRLSMGDYAERYQGIYERIHPSTQRRVDRSGPVMDVIEADRESRLPRRELADRQRWRDERLMELLAHKNLNEVLTNRNRVVSGKIEGN